MELELKDLTTSQTIMVPEGGITFGRTGGEADVQLSDNGVSKRHARIWGEGGAWFLEDLGSSNGTYVQNERIKEPIELLPGDIFQLSKLKFEVVQSSADGEEEQQEEEAPPPPAPKARPAAASQSKPAVAPVKKAAPAAKAAPEPTRQAPAKKAAPAKAAPKDQAVEEEDEAARDEGNAGGDEDGAGAEAQGFGYFMKAVPKAIVYYLGAIPLLLVNPFGAVRKGIEEQKAEPMGNFPLIAYAFPAMLVNQVLPAVAGGIATLVTTHHFDIMAFIPIKPLILAAVSAIISGFIWHPLLKWVIEKLQGESDERSRTNYFLMAMTVMGVLAVPNALAILLGMIPLRIIAFIGPLLSAAAGAAGIYVHYRWFEYFKVVKWFRIVLLVLGALGVLGGVASGLSTLINGTGTATVASSGSGDADAAAEEARKAFEAQIEAAKAAGMSADDIAKMQEANKQAQEAIAANAAAAAAAGAAGAEAAAKAAEQVKAAAEAAAKAGAAGAAAAAEATNDGKAAGAAVGTGAAAVKAPPPALGGAGYGAWRKKFDWIEATVTADPTVLKRDDVKALYQAIQEKVSDVEAEFARGKRQEARLNAHLKDVELYEKTEKETNELFSKLK